MTVKRYSAHTNIDDFKADWHEKKDGPMVRYEDYAALREERDALAVENTELKEQTPDVRSTCMFEAIEKAEKFMDEGMPELAMVEAFEILKMKRTPATDAAIANIQAQGADAVAAHHHKQAELLTGPYSEMLHVHRYGCNAAKHVAEQLRKGGTHD